MEVVATKVDKRLRLDSNTLSVKESKTMPDADVNIAFELMNCFRRRAVAYEFAYLISYNAQEVYVQKLFKHLSLEAPPNFAQTTLTQLVRADRQVFGFMSQDTPDIRPQPGGIRPLDAALEKALNDYHTAFCLMPMPKEHASPFQPWRQKTGEQWQQPDWF